MKMRLRALDHELKKEVLGGRRRCLKAKAQGPHRYRSKRRIDGLNSPVRARPGRKPTTKDFVGSGSTHDLVSATLGREKYGSEERSEMNGNFDGGTGK